MCLISLSRGGGLGVESYVSMPGGTLLLTYADKRGEGGQKSENFADMICERSLMAKNLFDVEPPY